MADFLPGELITEEIRIAFPSLDAPRRVLDSKRETYQATLLLPADFDLKPLRKAIAAVVREQWGDTAKKKGDRIYVVKGKKRVALRLPIIEAAEKADQYDGYDEDGHYVNASSGMQPRLVDRRNRAADAEGFYGGCWCRVHLKAYAWDNKSGCGVSFSLEGLQKTKDDERFGGGGMSSENAFESLDPDDEDELEEDEDSGLDDLM